jgi:multidrug efflux pump subunit AcrA (membrane-fusion protein)
LVVAEKPLYSVATGTVTDSFRLAGQVVPSESVQLAFAVDGRLAKLYVTAGASVEEGAILAELEMQDLDEQLAQAQLTLDQATEQLAQDTATRTYTLARARLNLQREQLRLEALQKDKDVRQPLTRSEAATILEMERVHLQQAQAAYDRAAAKPGVAASPEAVALQLATFEFTLAEIRFKQATGQDYDTEIALQAIQVQLQQLEVQQIETPDTSTLERKITSAQLEVESLQRRIEERRLRAPFGGVALAVGLQVTGYGGRSTVTTQPKTGDAMAAFAPLVILAKREGLEINVSATGQRVAELAVGMPVTITHPLARNRPFGSHVVSIPVQDLNGATTTGSQVVRIAMPADAPSVNMGDYVEVLIVKTVHQNALYIPPAALRQFGGRNFVVVQEGDKQRRVDVVTGLSNDLQVEIVSGLKASDILVGQ